MVKSILFFPNKDGIINKYVDRSIEILESEVQAVVDNKVNFRSYLNPVSLFFSRNTYDVAIVNWLENSFFIGGKMTFRSLFTGCFVFLVLRVVSKKMIFVQHNKSVHGTTAVSRLVSKFIISCIKFFSSASVIHDPTVDEKGKRLCYIPHPLYKIDNTESNSSLGDYYCIFGRIEPYKGIEETVNRWPASEKLIIIGASRGDTYLKYLQEVSKDKNVEFYPNPEDFFLHNVLSGAKGIVVDHIGQNNYVSGTLFYALSIKVPVYLPNTKFTKYLCDKYIGIYLYEGFDVKGPKVLFSGQGTSIELGEFSDFSIGSAWKSLIERIYFL